MTKNRRDGVLVVKDGYENETEVCFMNSDFTYHEKPQGEAFPILHRTGALAHLKKGDQHGGFGIVRFSLKYINADIRHALISPLLTTAINLDRIPDAYPCVHLEFRILDSYGEIEELHNLHNVWFDAGKVIFNEGDDYDSLVGEGVIFGRRVYFGEAEYEWAFLFEVEKPTSMTGRFTRAGFGRAGFNRI